MSTIFSQEKPSPGAPFAQCFGFSPFFPTSNCKHNAWKWKSNIDKTGNWWCLTSPISTVYSGRQIISALGPSILNSDAYELVCLKHFWQHVRLARLLVFVSLLYISLLLLIWTEYVHVIWVPTSFTLLIYWLWAGIAYCIQEIQHCFLFDTHTQHHFVVSLISLHN